MSTKWKRRPVSSAERKRRSEVAKAAWQRKVRSELHLKRSRASKKGWETRRARPKQGGWELRSKAALVKAVMTLPGTGRGNTPRNLAHRALQDRIGSSQSDWHDFYEDLDLEIDHDEWDDLFNHYH